MTGLLSIAAITETVAGVTVRGVSAKGIAMLLADFPALRALMTGREVDAEALISVAPDAIAGIIAAGIGFPGDAEQVDAAASLPVEVQADFLTTILKLTFPKGPASFLEKINSLGGVLNPTVGSVDTAQVTKSRKAS